MTSYESLHIFKLIEIKIPSNFLALWNFFLQFSTSFKIKQYRLSPVISMHVENQCSSPLSRLIFNNFLILLDIISGGRSRPNISFILTSSKINL